MGRRTTIELSDDTLKRLCEILAPMVARELCKQDGRLLTTKEKASQLNITEGTLRQWVSQGKIDCVKQGDKKQSRTLFYP